MNDIKGQEHVKRALEVACAGRHSILLVGPTGCGKTMLADRTGTITDRPILTLDNITERRTGALRRQIDRLEYLKKIIIAVMLPCPCGNFTSQKKECRCMPKQIQKHMAKVPDFILDRIDIHVNVPELKYDEISARRSGERSVDIKKRTDAVKLKKLEIDGEGVELLKMAVMELGLSTRAYDKIVKIANTIACMEGEPAIGSAHISEAVSYRCMDRNL